MNSHKLIVYSFNGCLPIPENGNYKFRIEYFDYYSQEKLTNSELNQDLVITTDSIEPLKIEIPLNGNIVLFNVLIRLTNFTSSNSGTFYQFKTNVYSNCNSGGRLPADPEIISTVICPSIGEIDSYILCNNEEQETSTHTSTTTIILTTTGTTTSTSTLTSTSTSTSSTSTSTSTQTSTSTSTITTTFLPCFIDITSITNVSNNGLTFELDYENIDRFYWFLYNENNNQVAFDLILINGSQTSFNISFVGYPNIDLTKQYSLGIAIRDCSIQELIPSIATTTSTTTLTTTKLTTSSTTTQTTTKLPTTTQSTTSTTTKLITTTNNNCNQFGIINISNVTANGLTLLIDFDNNSTGFNWILRNKNNNIIERSGTITLTDNHLFNISFFELSNEIDLSVPHSFTITSIGCNGTSTVDLPITATTTSLTTTKLTTTPQPTTTKLTTTVPQSTTTKASTTTVSCLIDIIGITNITTTGATITVTGNTNFNWYLYTLTGDIIVGGYIVRSGNVYNINFSPAEINLSNSDFRIEVRAEGCSAIDSLNFPQTTTITSTSTTGTTSTTNQCSKTGGIPVFFRNRDAGNNLFTSLDHAISGACANSGSGYGIYAKPSISVGATLFSTQSGTSCAVMPDGYYYFRDTNFDLILTVARVQNGFITETKNFNCI